MSCAVRRHLWNRCRLVVAGKSSYYTSINKIVSWCACSTHKSVHRLQIMLDGGSFRFNWLCCGQPYPLSLSGSHSRVCVFLPHIAGLWPTIAMTNERFKAIPSSCRRWTEPNQTSEPKDSHFCQLEKKSRPPDWSLPIAGSGRTMHVRGEIRRRLPIHIVVILVCPRRQTMTSLARIKSFECTKGHQQETAADCQPFFQEREHRFPGSENGLVSGFFAVFRVEQPLETKTDGTNVMILGGLLNFV